MGLSKVVLVVKNLPANGRDARDRGSTLGSGRYPGVGNRNPLQHSCLENSKDRGAWWATVHGFRKSWTQLSTHTHNYTHTYMQYVGYTLKKKNFVHYFFEIQM